MRAAVYETLPEHQVPVRRTRIDLEFVQAVLKHRGLGFVAGPTFQDRHQAERAREAVWYWFRRNHPELRCSTCVIRDAGGYRIAARVEPREAEDG